MGDGGIDVNKNEYNPAVPTAFGHRGHTGDKGAKDGCVHGELPAKEHRDAGHGKLCVDSGPRPTPELQPKALCL